MPPTLIAIDDIAEVEREVFGPVLHVLRYARADLDCLIARINATGYGLTFGLHTRISETVTRVLDRIAAGNLYVNRNIIGAVVGVQPFGGSGLSGTGPKAGGPLALRRLLADPPAPSFGIPGPEVPAARAYAGWLREVGRPDLAARVAGFGAGVRPGTERELPGPVGERNLYALRPRGLVAAMARSGTGLRLQVGMILATGNRAVAIGPAAAEHLHGLPPEAAATIQLADDLEGVPDLCAVLHAGDRAECTALARQLAARDGPVVALQSLDGDALAAGRDYDPIGLLAERSVSINTAAAGGNASLMTLEG